MKRLYRNIIALLLIVLTSSAAYSFDLPVKRISGTDYYLYTVGRNESLSDVAEKLGITRHDIVKSNPAASDGVRAGMTLFFPVKDFTEDNHSLPGQSSSRAGSSEPTRYKVQEGETLFGIAKRFGVSYKDIVALNPDIKSGVKAGQVIVIPGADQTVGQTEEDHSGRLIRPINVPYVTYEEPTSADNETPAQEEAPAYEESYNSVDPLYDNVESVDVKCADPVGITVMLPFTLDSSEESKQTRMSSDFIRGFMLGVKSMNDIEYYCHINVFDTKGESGEIADILSKSLVKESKVIIAQDDNSNNAILSEFATDNRSYMLNLFSAHDSTYIINPYYMQSNIPASMMYEKAAQAVMNAYPDHVPVFLVAKGGRGEKFPFTSFLQEKYRENGIDPIELTYEGMLTSANIEDMDFAGRYVFIPPSGSLSEFNKFAHTLLAIKENHDDPSAIALFGYPDWTTFRGESLEILHRMGAMIYSRFYCDEKSASVKRFLEKFEKTYGSMPLEQVPSQAMLGYDSARYLMNNISTNEGEFLPLESESFRGLQSTFMFEEYDGRPGEQSGYVNTALYIITFMPGTGVSIQVL